MVHDTHNAGDAASEIVQPVSFFGLVMMDKTAKATRTCQCFYVCN